MNLKLKPPLMVRYIWFMFHYGRLQLKLVFQSSLHLDWVKFSFFVFAFIFIYTKMKKRELLWGTKCTLLPRCFFWGLQPAKVWIWCSTLGFSILFFLLLLFLCLRIRISLFQKIIHDRSLCVNELSQFLSQIYSITFIPLKYYENNTTYTLIWYILLPISNLPYPAGPKPNISVLRDFRILIYVELDVTGRFPNARTHIIN